MPRFCAAVLLLFVFAACSAPAPVAPPPHITGSVTYRQRVNLPPDAVLEIQLLDLTRTDVPAEALNTVTIASLPTVPIYFKVRYDARRIEPDRIYALRARILVGGEPLFLSAGNTRVLTGGHPGHLDLVLEMARRP